MLFWLIGVSLVVGQEWQLKARLRDTQQDKTAGALYGRWRLSLLLTGGLGLDDPRSDEENQLLVRSADLRMFKQVAQVRDVAEQRHLADLH